MVYIQTYIHLISRFSNVSNHILITLNLYFCFWNLDHFYFCSRCSSKKSIQVGVCENWIQLQVPLAFVVSFLFSSRFRSPNPEPWGRWTQFNGHILQDGLVKKPPTSSDIFAPLPGFVSFFWGDFNLRILPWDSLITIKRITIWEHIFLELFPNIQLTQIQVYRHGSFGSGGEYSPKMNRLYRYRSTLAPPKDTVVLSKGFLPKNPFASAWCKKKGSTYYL